MLPLDETRLTQNDARTSNNNATSTSLAQAGLGGTLEPLSHAHGASAAETPPNTTTPTATDKNTGTDSHTRRPDMTDMTLLVPLPPPISATNSTSSPSSSSSSSSSYNPAATTTNTTTTATTSTIPTTTTATTTAAPTTTTTYPTHTTQRPYSSSGPNPYTNPHLYLLTTRAKGPGPSISARTSVTRVGPEDDDDDGSPPFVFPARPATAAAATSTGLGGGPGGAFGLFRPRLRDVPSAEGSDPEIVMDDDYMRGEVAAEEEEQRQQQQQILASASSAPLTLPEPPSALVAPASGVPPAPQALITFLLVTGRRRTMAFDGDTRIGRVKELVWNTWPEDEEWRDERPPAPSYLRLLYLGRLLQDEDTLSKLKIPTSTPPLPSQPTIVHLSIRPHAPPGTENADIFGKKSLLRRSGTNGTAETVPGCCGCIIC